MKHTICAIYALLFLLSCALPAKAENLLFLRGKELWISDTNGMSQRRLNVFRTPSDPALSPDGGMAALAAGSDEQSGLSHIYVLPTQTWAPRRLFIQGVQAGCCPSFSPDGRSLLIVSVEDVHNQSMDNFTYATVAVSRIDLEQNSVENLLETKDVMLDAGYLYANPVFSPDGERVAYQHSGSDVSGGFSIVDLQGKVLQSYPSNQEDYRPYWKPQFLPDQKSILCWSPAVNKEENSEIAVINMETGERSVLAQGSNPTLVNGGTAMIYEKCDPNWGGATTCDLWRQELREGAAPMRVVTNAHSPAGQYPGRP